jgi:hypothetical protein
MATMSRLLKWYFLALLVSSCSVLPQVPTVTPTRSLSAPTLQASPTTFIRSSDELYGTITDGQNSLTAAALPNVAALPPLSMGTPDASGGEVVQVILTDGTIINATLYQVAGAVRVPGILLLVQDAAAWGAFPAELKRAGFTVLVVPYPGVIPIADLDVLLTSLSEDGSVDPSRIAIIGGEQSADAALLGCASFDICDAVVLLTPQGRSTLLNVLPNLDPRFMLVLASRENEEFFATAVSLVSSYQNRSQLIEASAGIGAAMLQQDPVRLTDIVTWLGQTLVTPER